MGQTSAVARAKDGCQLSYRLLRNAGKPRVALIHSLGLAGAMWEQVIGQIATRKPAEILVYDCRGHGRSERWPGPYTVELFADDLAALFDACSWSSGVVVGCSMGGCVAQAFAGKYPERVHGLVLIDTTAWYGPTAPQDWKARAAKAAEGGLAAMTEFQLSRWLSDHFREKHPEVAKQMSEIFLANDLASYQATCEMLGNADFRDATRRFRMPVSVIVGEEDYATPVAMSQSLHEAIQSSTLDVIPAARHLTPVECPSEIAATLCDLRHNCLPPTAGPPQETFHHRAMNGLSLRMRKVVRGAFFALQRPACDAPVHIDSSELEGVTIRWPAELEWVHSKTWVEPLFYGLRARVPVTVHDIPQRPRNTNEVVVIEFCRGDRVHRVALNISDYPDLVHLGKDDGSSPPLALEFKMQFRKSGYGNDKIVPGGYVSDSARLYWHAARGARRLRDRRQFHYDVYGRFNLKFATEIRTRALQVLQNQSRVRFYGGATKVNFSEFLREIACARVCLDLPGRGPFCFRLVSYLGLGACVISVPHAATMPVPLVDRTHIVYTRPDMSDLVDLCEHYVNDAAAREAVMTAARDYYRRHLYWRSLSDYYLRTMLDRLPP